MKLGIWVPAIVYSRKYIRFFSFSEKFDDFLLGSTPKMEMKKIIILDKKNWPFKRR